MEQSGCSEIEVKITQQYIGKNALDNRVMPAMSQVPRREFITREFPIPLMMRSFLPFGSGHTISQPYIAGLMSGLLDLKTSDSMLETPYRFRLSSGYSVPSGTTDL